MVEILVRLGFALLLSLCLAVLLAWGWDTSDPSPATASSPLLSAASTRPLP